MTSAHQFAGPVQYIEETTEGITPTTGSTTALSVKSVSIKKDGQFVDIDQVGTEDLLDIIQGMKKPELQLRVVASGIAFIKRGFNAQNLGTITGTISATLSIIIPIRLNNIVNYLVFTGCRERQVAVTMDIGKEIEFTIDFVCKTSAKATTTAPTGLTLTTTFPTAAVFTWTDGGTSPISWNAVAINAKKFTCTVARNTSVDHILGNIDPYGSLPHGRRITGDFTILYTNTTLETDHDAGTKRTLVATFKTGVAVLTLTNTQLKTHSIDYDEGDTEATVVNYSYGAVSCNLA